jgi:uncharacterized membrane protein YphA (DoxX/SURF4 family)
MPLLRRVARPMLASLFIYGGINSLRNPAAHADAAKPVLDYAAPVIDKAVEASPLETRPDNETLVRIDGAVKVAAGTLLALGKFPRLSSAALAATLIPTTAAAHRFWEETDPATKQAQQVQFLKNTALLGGLMIAAADTHGKPSVAWRSRKAAEAASAAISAQAGALSDSVSHAGESVSGLFGSASSDAADRASALTDAWADKAPVVKARAAELGAAASEWGSAASDRAAELGAAASERAGELGAWGAAASEDLSKRAAKAAQKAEKRGAALQKEVDKRSAAWQKELDKRGKAWEKLADKKGAEWADNATKTRASLEKAADKKRAEWEKSARKAAKKARKRAPGYVDQLSALATQAADQAVRFGGDVASRAPEAQSAVEGIVRDARKRAAKVVAP